MRAARLATCGGSDACPHVCCVHRFTVREYVYDEELHSKGVNERSDMKGELERLWVRRVGARVRMPRCWARLLIVAAVL